MHNFQSSAVRVGRNRKKEKRDNFPERKKKILEYTNELP